MITADRGPPRASDRLLCPDPATSCSFAPAIEEAIFLPISMGTTSSTSPWITRTEGQQKEADVTRTVPSEAATRDDIRQGFVYQRVPHITLKSIANNADIDEIWEQAQATLEPLRNQLNATLGTSWEEWEIPREAGDPWAADMAKLHTSLAPIKVELMNDLSAVQALRQPERISEVRRKRAREAKIDLDKLNALLGRSYSLAQREKSSPRLLRFHSAVRDTMELLSRRAKRKRRQSR